MLIRNAWNYISTEWARFYACILRGIAPHHENHTPCSGSDPHAQIWVRERSRAEHAEHAKHAFCALAPSCRCIDRDDPIWRMNSNDPSQTKRAFSTFCFKYFCVFRNDIFYLKNVGLPNDFWPYVFQVECRWLLSTSIRSQSHSPKWWCSLSW